MHGHNNQLSLSKDKIRILLLEGINDSAVELITGSGYTSTTRLMKALDDYRITNMSAAATHYRMMKNSGKGDDFSFHFKKLTFTGEPIDPATLEWIDQHFKVPACSMYGTTEIGVVLVNYPGAEDFRVKPGSLGKPVRHRPSPCTRRARRTPPRSFAGRSAWGRAGPRSRRCRRA